MNDPKTLARLLRSIANGTEAQANKHDVIFNAAAEWLELLATFSQDELQALGEGTTVLVGPK